LPGASRNVKGEVRAGAQLRAQTRFSEPVLSDSQFPLTPALSPRRGRSRGRLARIFARLDSSTD
jgi:hypothetical protein